MYELKNIILKSCFKHTSLGKNNLFNRLEFLGDSILGATIAKLIFLKKTSMNLSIIKAELVRTEKLAEIGKSFLIPHIKYEGKLTDNILAACLEAWIGAVYIDGGPIEDIIVDLWSPFLYENYEKDPKNQLQEKCQRLKIKFNYEYELKYDKFTCNLYLTWTNGSTKIESTGTSKLEASRSAAKLALFFLENKSFKNL